jgi:nucleoside-diphosphate-sugar epimerase
MRILLTGASGFLGTHINSKLQGFDITSLGRNGSDIFADITDKVPPLPFYDLVVHAAGKAHSLPISQKQAEEFYAVNTKGTENLLNGLNEHLPSTFVFISSVAVYGKVSGLEIDEGHPLLADSPYAISKLRAEELVRNWGLSTGVPIVILRLPLIVGLGAPGNLGAMVNAIKRGYYFRIGSGNASRSMVLVEDIANLIPTLINKSGTFNLTDGYDPTYRELDTHIANQLGKSVKSVPLKLVRILARFGDSFKWFPINSYRLKKLETSLTFSSIKASQQLNWKPNQILQHRWL